MLYVVKIIIHRPDQSGVSLVLRVPVSGRLGRQDTFVVAGVGGIAIPLLVHREVHVDNLLVACEVGKVSRNLACAGVAIMGSVKPTRETIPPVVVLLNWMGWVVAWSLHGGVVASAAPTAVAVIVLGAARVGL